MCSILRRNQTKHVLLFYIFLFFAIFQQYSLVACECDDAIKKDENTNSPVALAAAGMVSSRELTNSYLQAGSCEQVNEILYERLERLERIFNISQFNPDLDDVSILEIMFHSVSEKLLKSIPETDAECKFNFVTGACNPKCTCGFKPKLGDYSLSRACRKLSVEEMIPGCDEEATKNDSSWVSKLANKTKEKLHQLKVHIEKHSPPTDKECRFSIRKLKCVPVHMCTFDFQLGDYSLSRACRLRLDDESESLDEDADLVNDSIYDDDDNKDWDRPLENDKEDVGDRDDREELEEDKEEEGEGVSEGESRRLQEERDENRLDGDGETNESKDERTDERESEITGHREGGREEERERDRDRDRDREGNKDDERVGTMKDTNELNMATEAST